MKRSPLYPLAVWIFWVLVLPLALMVAGITLVVTTPIGDLPFDRPDLWWLGAAVPLGSLLFLYGLWQRRRAVARFASPALVESLAARISPARAAIKSFLLLGALLALVIALLGPRWGLTREKAQVYGVDVVVALDLSRSMLASDLQPSRLEAAKQAIRQQLLQRPVFRRANRMALLVFAGTTSLRVPLTTDHLAFQTRLDEVTYGDVPRGGTAIARAIEASADLFARSPAEATKILLLFTDGEDHEGDPVEAARTVSKEHGIRVYTVGVGDPSSTAGAQVPAGPDKEQRPFLHDGQIVFSKLNVDALRRTAEAGGGSFAHLDSLHRLVNEIAKLWKSELTVEEREVHRPRYQWFLTAALLALAVEVLLRGHRRGPAPLPDRPWQPEPA